MGAEKLLPYFDYESIHEMDDGGPGSCIGYLVAGHVEYFDIECFLARDVDDFEDAPQRGFDIEHVWWRTEPYLDGDGDEQESSFIYVYDADGSKGGHAATKVEIETTWERRCFQHPFEVAKTALHKSRIALDEEHLADDRGYIYLCSECYDRWLARLDVALAKIRQGTGAPDA